jgi:ribonuclease HI
MGKSKIYVVAKGKTPGIYTAWAGVGQAQEQVKGFPGAVYKSFPTAGPAKAWLETVPGYHPDVMTELEKQAPGAVPSSRESGNPSFGHQADLAQGKAVIYTDGGCLGNPGPGGYAAIVLQGDDRTELSGGFRRTTNNRMEVLACIVGLETLMPETDVVVISDSKYTVNAMAKGWAKKWRAKNWMRTPTEPAKNADLWKRMLEVSDERKVTFRWVKGHAGTKENERCDVLAVAAANGQDLQEDTGFAEESKPLSLF